MAERYVLRALAISDIHKGMQTVLILQQRYGKLHALTHSLSRAPTGFMQLLGQLTVAGDVSKAQFTREFLNRS